MYFLLGNIGYFFSSKVNLGVFEVGLLELVYSLCIFVLLPHRSTLTMMMLVILGCLLGLFQQADAQNLSVCITDPTYRPPGLCCCVCCFQTILFQAWHYFDLNYFF